MQINKRYITSLVEQGGPDPSEYSELNNWFSTVASMVKSGDIARSEVQRLWTLFGDAFSEHTMQGFVVKKPHGYAGDFEIIDRIYTKWISPKEHLKKWDEFFHWQKAPQAVRNRKDYFKEMLRKLDDSEYATPTVLNVGSGPCRDIFEYKCDHSSTTISFDCLDMDPNAIKYSKKLLNGANVTHYCQHANRFQTDRRYELIWSAGLFDYLDNKKFVALLRSLWNMVALNGKLIIGNFSPVNPSRDYMEFGEWNLFHRDAGELFELTRDAGVSHKSIEIDSEASGVNLFLQLSKNIK